MTTMQVWNVEAGVSEGVFEVPTVAEALRLAHVRADEEGAVDFRDSHAEVRELSAEPSDEHDFGEVESLTVRVLKRAA